MSEMIDIVAGWTGPLDFQLLVDGVVPATPLSGTIELVLKGRDGVAIDTTGDVAILDAALWKVRYTPDSADLVSTQSPYRAHFKVTSAGAAVFFPNGEADIWRVYAA